ncbi:MAG TPA: isoprenylcysteine carboxylmethyltransferase family protein [Caulobacteraceae bacterium]|nr:isoprenylcysteine carboxylmethyltransferase family protein [Caulobacteraceae bacterium]
MSPLGASVVAIGLWVLSWFMAAIWTRRAAARPPLLDQAAYIVPTAIGGVLLYGPFEARAAGAFHLAGDWTLLRPPGVVGWALFVVCLAGLGFTWWARLTLGSLWSGTVQRKEAHAIVETGPYRLVRHPIYTGLLAAFASVALQLASPLGFVGFAFFTLGFFLKARLEERFLMAELGESAYADYRRRTPMLVPFWPVRG